MNLNELKAQVALGEDSRRQFKRDDSRLPKSRRLRKPGIKRALEDWPQIEFSDDRDGNLFTVTVHRKEVAVSPEIESGSEKSSEKILGLLRTSPDLAAREIADRLGITQRAVEKQISKLREEGRLRRIGPDKGGHWEVIE